VPAAPHGAASVGERADVGYRVRMWYRHPRFACPRPCFPLRRAAGSPPSNIPELRWSVGGLSLAACARTTALKAKGYRGMTAPLSSRNRILDLRGPRPVSRRRRGFLYCHNSPKLMTSWDGIGQN
jgi:hypothetical protein